MTKIKAVLSELAQWCIAFAICWHLPGIILGQAAVGVRPHEDGRLVQWSVEQRDWLSKGADPFIGNDMEQVASLIHYSLNNAESWTRAGLVFERTANEDQATIRIHIIDKPDVESKCGNRSLSACARAHWGHCDIWLVLEVVSLPTTESANAVYRQLHFGVLHHEVGHCFGFRHAEAGLMRASGHPYGSLLTPMSDDDKPSDSMIEEVANRPVLIWPFWWIIAIRLFGTTVLYVAVSLTLAWLQGRRRKLR